MVSRERVRWAARVAFWGALAVAYVAAVMPQAPSLGAGDKVDHGTAFVTLAVLARLGWSRGRAWAIGLALVGFGALIELSQALPVVARDASWRDLLADAVAVALGLLAGTIALAAIRRHLAAAA